MFFIYCSHLKDTDVFLSRYFLHQRTQMLAATLIPLKRPFCCHSSIEMHHSSQYQWPAGSVRLKPSYGTYYIPFKAAAAPAYSQTLLNVSPPITSFFLCGGSTWIEISISELSSPICIHESRNEERAQTIQPPHINYN